MNTGNKKLLLGFFIGLVPGLIVAVVALVVNQSNINHFEANQKDAVTKATNVCVEAISTTVLAILEPEEFEPVDCNKIVERELGK